MAIILRILFICALVVFASCVNTIEDKKASSSTTTKGSSAEVQFAGITTAIPVSNSKVDIFFRSGSLTPDKSKYLVYVNNSSTPIEINGNRIAPSLVRSGEFRITIDNLLAGTNYTFSVALKDSDTGIESNSNKKISARTFDNLTADFRGLLSVSPVDGENGKTSALVKWIPAVIKGNALGALAEDPITYRIQYLDADLGYPSDLVNESNSNIVTYLSNSTNGQLDKNSADPILYQNFQTSYNSTESVVIPGLIAGKKYYFLVRAIHLGYREFKESPNYKFEKNLNVQEVAMLNPTDYGTWNEQSVKSEVVLNDSTLTKRNLTWDKANGLYTNYRIYVRDMGFAPNINTKPDVDAINIALNNSTPMPVSGLGFISQPNKPYIQLSGLTAYRHYNVIVATCFNTTCADEASRILSPVHTFQLLPQIAPFFGLYKINNPESSTNLNTISLRFDSPIVTAGYLTDLEVYCMPGASANPVSSAVLMERNVAIADNHAYANCQGLTRITATPANFSSFTKIDITADPAKPFIPAGMVLSGLEYCFGIVPVIKNGTNVIYRDLANMVTKCSYIQKRMPTSTEFTGAVKLCAANVDDTLKVSWSKPTAGIYSGYTVFWKKNNGKPFLFSEAIATAEVAPVGSFTMLDDVYYKTSLNNVNTLQTNLNGLEPGSRYFYGVLAHDLQNSQYTYSDINSSVQDCSIKLPDAIFDEWVDILAIGPKENALEGYNANGTHQNFIAETLNEYGQPVELEVDITSGQESSRSMSTYGDLDYTFNGAYGYLNNNPLSGFRTYSNTGIVRIAWKDIKLASGTLNKLILANDKFDKDNNPILKPDRKYGYHVYRSDDNQGSWKRLTGSEDFQKPKNLGLLHPSKYYEWKKSNGGYISDGSISTINQAYFNGADSYMGVTFTDYSVVASQRAGINSADKARVYYYKIVPVVNGSELAFSNTSSTPQNIVKVVLPPRNMAYVSRLMANRQTCLELGKTPSKDVSTFYSCKYNGLGSTSLTKPTQAKSSGLVYDFGKDILIDRFELGCNVTRGSVNENQSSLVDENSQGLLDLANFDGSSLSGKFQGCAFVQNDTSLAGGFNASAGGYLTPYGFGLGQLQFDKIDQANPLSQDLRKGDCISRSHKSIKSGAEYLMVDYPGFYGDVVEGGVTTMNFMNVYSLDSVGYSKFAAQSEFGAVHYNLAKNSYYMNSRIPHQARGGSAANKTRLKRYISGASSCTVNLPSVLGTQMIPRWISANGITDLTYEKEEIDTSITKSNFPITTKTIGWLTTPTEDDATDPNYLYDDQETLVPDPGFIMPTAAGRFDLNTKLGRVISSNSAKLPPITGLDLKGGSALCSTYGVEVGYESNGVWNTLKAEVSKRLMRRTEGIIANAWPKMFVEGRGRRVAVAEGVSTIIPESERPLIHERPANEKLPLVDLVKIEQGTMIPRVLGSTDSPTYPSVDFNGSCNSLERVATGSYAPENLFPGKEFPVNLGPTTTSYGRSFFLTGSSIFDFRVENNINSQNCISRYGLQDIVGNVAELSSDEFYCNTVAARDGAQVGLFDKDNATDVDARVPSSGQYFDRDAIVARGYVTDTLNEAQVGSCAVNSTGNDRSSTLASSRLFVNGTTFMRELKDMWGSFSSLILTQYRSLFDPEFVETVRDGDGYFLDFGKNMSLAVELRHGSELKLYNVPANLTQSQYFSPVFGIPLKCPEMVCGTENDTTKSDNLNITTQTLYSTSVDKSFPIGNSQIDSSGVLAIMYDNTYTLGLEQRYPNTELSGVITSIYRDSGTNETVTVVNNNFPTFGYANTKLVSTATWAANLNYTFHLHNFGSARTVASGRYSADIFALAPDYEGNRLSGARCAISLD